MKNIYKFLIFSGIVFILLFFDLVQEGLHYELIGAAIASGILVIANLLLDSNYLCLRLKCLCLQIRRKKIRLSLAYQILVKHRDKLVLVPVSSGRFLQLVGGKYKYTSSAKSFIDSIKHGVDHHLNETAIRKQDLALYLLPKNLIRILKWFDSGAGRERDPWREFAEEILQLGASSDDGLKGHQLLFHKVKTINTPLRYNYHLKDYELIRYDIFEIEFLPGSKGKMSVLLDQAVKSEQITLASEEELKNGCIAEGIHGKISYLPIAKHARWVMNSEYDDDLEVWDNPKTLCGSRYTSEGAVITHSEA